MKDGARLLEEKYSGQATPEYEKDLKRLEGGEPLAYIIGWQPFLDLQIALDSKPLIPRPETEWWTEQFIAKIKERVTGAGAVGEDSRDLAESTGIFAASASRIATAHATRSLRVLDLCAGSGAIGCAILARIPDARVYFGEIDPAHEKTIRKNIEVNGLDTSRADIRIGDLFEPFDDLVFDFIAANPPYIPSARALPESVADFEPAQALYAGEDGLALIRRIAQELPKRLSKGGEAWIECDSERAEAARALFEAEEFAVTVRTDQYGVPRLLVVSFR